MVASTFDPQDFGACCSICPLRKWRVGGPVPPEINVGATILAVGDFPGSEEVDRRHPFSGSSGKEVNQALSMANCARGEISWINACQCRPPGDEMDDVLDKVRKLNKDLPAGKKLTSPLVCCRPFVLNFLRQYSNVFAFGKRGFQSILGDFEVSILNNRGGRITAEIDDVDQTHKLQKETDIGFGGHRVSLMPTFHPSFVMHKRRWTHVFRADVNRGVRWFRGSPGWQDPKMILFPTIDQVRDFLLTRKFKYVAYDTETEYFKDRPETHGPLRARLRCYSFGIPDEALVVPFLSVDQHTRFWQPDEEEEVKEILRQFFLDRSRLKIGWNAGWFDRIVVQRHLGVVPVPLVDAILLHRAVDPEMPHDLGFAGSFYTDVPRWKADHTAITAQTDEDLYDYAAKDAAVNAQVYEPILQGVVERKQLDVVKMDHQIQGVCANLTIIGMPVDQEIRKEQDDKLVQGIVKWKRECQRVIGDAGHSPGSYQKVRSVLFDRFGLEPTKFTDKGEPSTGDDAIIEFLTKKSLKPQVREYLIALRWYRRLTKFKGTYTSKLRRCDEVWIPSEDEVDENDEEVKLEKDIERSVREKDKKKRGCTSLDDRLHVGWNAHSTVSHRLSSSEPFNLQNVSKKLRVIFKPKKGFVFAYADMDQLELRFVAGLAKASRYLEVFHNAFEKRKTLTTKAEKEAIKLDPNYDPHAASAAMIYNKDWSGANDDLKDKMRTFAKTFVYANLYGAEAPTVHSLIISSEDKAGKLIYLDRTMKETRLCIENWFAASPEIEQWHSSIFEEYRRKGFITEPVLGCRRDFLDGKNLNPEEEEKTIKGEVRNFKPQCVPGFSKVINREGPCEIGGLVGKEFETWTGVRWAKATAIARGIASIKIVKTNLGNLYCNDSHQLKVGGYRWTKVSDLQLQSQVAMVSVVQYGNAGLVYFPTSATVLSIDDTGSVEPVFTLVVDDPDHQYVADGFISHNCGGAMIVNRSTMKLVNGPLPFFKWGPNTGLINQCHDALLFEIPESVAEFARVELEDAMTSWVPGLDVPFTASAKIITDWSQG